jgi:tripeptidyl-peptidase-1
MQCLVCIRQHQQALSAVHCSSHEIDSFCASPISTDNSSSHLHQRQQSHDSSGTPPQTASTQFGSGGGFASHFKQPTWQKAAVKQYLDQWGASTNGGYPSPLPPAEAFNAENRGTPDVSMTGEGYQVLVNGDWHTVLGTSASAPAFAALVALLNEKRLQDGKSRLGFLNPWLYGLSSTSGGLVDVTMGTNAIGDVGGPVHGPLKYGWNASVGWDPVTGLGTPDFGRLLELMPI